MNTFHLLCIIKMYVYNTADDITLARSTVLFLGCLPLVQMHM